MAINKRFTQLNNSGSNHDLLDALSGKITGSFEVTGAAYFAGGLSGSLTKLVDGSDYLLAGPYITLATNSLGQIEVSGAAPPSSVSYWDSVVNGVIFTTASMVEMATLSASNGAEVSGSAIFAGAGGVTVGSDTVFFVSGALEGITNATGVAAFGGDVYVSGNMFVSGYGPGFALSVLGNAAIDGNYISFNLVPTDQAVFNGQVSASYGLQVAEITSATAVTILAPVTASVGLDLSGDSVFQAGSTFTFNGDGVFAAGLTGSLQEVSAGVPYLLAGPNITIATNSLGQVEITGSATTVPEYWASDVANNIFTTGSAVISSSLSVNPEGTGRGLLKFGGLDIGPITGSNYVVSADGTGYLSGSILSASNGVFDGTFGATVRHEFHIVAAAPDLNSIINSFAATYLVMSSIASSTGIQKVRSVTELSRETSGSYAANWDVNITEDGVIELTSSIDSGVSLIYWYAQRTKEMSINIVGSRS